jgi:transcriptional regulator with XRE-family HTH domain
MLNCLSDKDFEALLRRAFARAVHDLRQQRRPPRATKTDVFSQELLALEIGMDRSYVSALERGEHTPTITTMWKLSKVLHVSFTQMARHVERNYRQAKGKPMK